MTSRSAAVFAILNATMAIDARASVLFAMGRSANESALPGTSLDPFGITPVGTSSMERLAGPAFDRTRGLLYVSSGSRQE